MNKFAIQEWSNEPTAVNQAIASTNGSLQFIDKFWMVNIIT